MAESPRLLVGWCQQMLRTSVVEYLANFERHGSEVAYVNRRSYRSERWSYARTVATVYQFARELQSRGMKIGDRVMLWGESCAEWVVAFLGSALCGVVLVPLDNVSTNDFASRVQIQVEAKWLVCSRTHASADLSLPAIILEDLPQLV